MKYSKNGVMNDAEGYYKKGSGKKGAMGNRVVFSSKDMSSDKCARPVGRTSWVAGSSKAGVNAS